jgi:CPA2 family monovalent cation:H+ antiporter-2
MTVAAARQLAPELHIVARATTEDGTRRLTRLGAQDVIHPELEGGLEIVRLTLLRLGLPAQEINRYADAVRRDRYDLQINTEEEHRLLQDLLDAVTGIEIEWFKIPPRNPVVGQSLEDANLRARTGASVVAILRERELIANPKSKAIFQAGDRVGLIGDEQEIRKAGEILTLGDRDRSPSEAPGVYE